MTYKGSWQRPDGGNFGPGMDRVSPRCNWCRGRGTVTQKAADPAQPPVDVDCPKCKTKEKEE